MKDLAEASVYVGTYRKYNEGSIFGKWIDLSDFNSIDEFYIACKKIHDDEEDPEYMFQDWENIPDSLIGESWIASNTFMIIEAVQSMNEEHKEAFEIWCDNFHKDLYKQDIEDLINSFEDDYIGAYDSEKEFAEELADETLEIPSSLQYYFNYQRYADDIFSTDYWFNGGHVFRNS